jgi:eukaryotic-like serine/threonine-protein kinase
MRTSVQTEGAGSATGPVRFVAGDVIGPWAITGELGRGGMSTVYDAIHTDIGKRAALKIVRASALSEVYTAERVLREAQVVNRIGHRNIVDIFESGTLPDGRPYLVMERLEGCSLASWFAAGRIAHDEVVAILLQICDALAAAHACGVVHRDLKLDNVFLVDGPDGSNTHVKVLDWGIAKVLSENPRNTFCDRLIGTPQYVSPEQARGGDVTYAADVYSLGVMAYEMFLGAPPFVAKSAAEMLVMHLRDLPPPPREVWRDIPVVLEDLLLAMLAKEPTDRPTPCDVAERLLVVRELLLRRSAARLDGPPMLAPALAIPTPPPLAASSHTPPAPVRIPTYVGRMTGARGTSTRARGALVAALVAVALFASVGAMELLRSTDDAAAAAGGAHTSRGRKPTGRLPLVMPSALLVFASAGVAVPPTFTDDARATRTAERAAKPARRSRRTVNAADADLPSGSARPSIAPLVYQTRPKPPAARARREVTSLDPDGTLEPYR